jgi:hypothetical protein
VSRLLTSTGARAAALATLVAAVGVGASVVSGARGGHRPWRSPGELAGLLGNGGPRGTRVLISTTGKPILGKNAKPLRVASNGTILNASGHPILGQNNKPLKLGSGGTLPASVVGTPGGGATTTTTTTNTTPPGAPQHRQPLTRAPIVVGVPYQDAASANALYAQYGGHLQAADAGPEAQAIADYINAAGGIGGRPLVLRLDHVDYFDNQPYAIHDQQICDYFAQGVHPVAIIELSSACLMSHGIVTLENGAFNPTGYEAQYANTYFQPETLAIDRYAVPYVQGLLAQGFFSGDVRVGALFPSGGVNADAGVAALKSALAQAGVHLAASYTLGALGSSAGVPGLIADMGSALIRFRLANVNRVVSVDQGGINIALFMEVAQPQGYHPHYGISTLNEPNLLLATPSIAVPQLHGAVGVGWSPITDVGPDAEGPVPAQRAQCEAIFQRAGVNIGGRTDAGQYRANAVCDDLFLLRRALAGRNDLSPAAVRAGIESLGTSWISNIDFGTRLDPSHHDGAGAYRLMAFDDSCACVRYHGPLYGIA